MKVYREITDLRNDVNWSSGAKIVIDQLTDDELDTILSSLEENADEMSEEQLDDLFDYDADYIVGLIGFDSYEKFYKARSHNYEYGDEDRYCEMIDGEVIYSSDNLQQVIDSAIEDYENGESDGEDIEIYDQENDSTCWTTADSNDSTEQEEDE